MERYIDNLSCAPISAFGSSWPVDVDNLVHRARSWANARESYGTMVMYWQLASSPGIVLHPAVIVVTLVVPYVWHGCSNDDCSHCVNMTVPAETRLIQVPRQHEGPEHVRVKRGPADS